MAFGFGFGMPRIFSVARFSPLSLFASGAPGVWYDPSDYGATGTLFQDSAGTTPVTAVEQPVGLMLDKSQGLVLGPELVTNGDFSDGTTGWTLSSSAVVNNALDCLAAISVTFATRSITVVAGRTYQVSFTVSNYISGSVGLTLGVGANVSTSNFSGNGVKTSLLTAGTGNSEIRMGCPGSGFVGTLDNISVKELPGNHAFQATSASRPVLSARYNLLTKTEQFNDAVWTKASTSISANSAVAPDGTTTADSLIEDNTLNSHRVQQSVSTTAGVVHTQFVYAKKNTRSWIALYVSGANVGRYFDLTNGITGSTLVGAPITSTITSAGNDWYKCEITFTATATSTPQIYLATSDGVNNYTGNGTSGLYIWGASLVPANQSTLPYQRVNTATDYDTTGFLPYLKFDGVDDSLSTNSINFTSTDKMSVFAGVRKLSDAALAVGLEFSSNPSANNGVFSLYIPAGASPSYRYDSKGSSSVAAIASTGFASPISNVVTALSDILGDLATLRVNGAQVAQSTGDQGTGNYGNYPLYIGRRGGSSLPFNGQLYSMIIVGKAVTAGELSSTETYVNQKTGAY